MKKQIALILSLLLVVCVFGCTAEATIPEVPETSASDDSAFILQERFDMASAYVESLFDASKTEVQTDTEDPEYPQRYWYFSGPADGVNIPETVTVDGKSIVIGQTTVKELKELGFTVETSMDTVEPNTVLSFSIIDGRKKLVLTIAPNGTDQSIPFDDAIIAGFTGSFSAYSMPFGYAEITEASTLKDVISAFGIEAGETVIGLVADTTDTEITVHMFNLVQNGDTETNKSLDITLRYSASENIAKVTNVTLNIDAHPIPEE
jgi:hypothetical protein